jgi:spore germination protein KC
MIRKCLLAPVLLLLLTSGCWDYNELSDVFFVVGMAVDKGTEPYKYKMTVECIVPSEFNKTTGGRSAPSTVYSMQGNTVADIMRKMNIGLGRELIYSHMQLLAISEELAKDGDLQFFDTMERSRETRDNFNVIVVRNKQAEDVLKITNATEKYSTGKIKNQLDASIKEWGADPDVRLKDVLNARVAPGNAPVMASAVITGDPRKGAGRNNTQETVPEANVLISGLAVFKELKLAGFMDVEDTRSYLWLRGDLSNTSVTAACGDKKRITVRVTKSKTKVEASHQGEIPHFTVKIYADSFLELTECTDDISSPDTISKYSELIEQAVVDTVSTTVKKVQNRFQVDIFGFGSHMNRQEPKYFKTVKKDWNEHFSQAQVEVKTYIRIRRVGLNTSTISE